jgi:hypothetical protein
MKIIEHIRVYDCDDTLLFTPKPDVDENGEKIIRLEIIDGKKREFSVSSEFEEATGTPWAHKGWWGRRESLNPDVFDIKRNEFVYNEYLRDINGIDKLMIMMTGRIKPLERQVKHLLDMHNMEFDRYYFNPGGKPTLDYKIEVYQKYVDTMKDLKSLKMYDDRDEHIPEFVSWAEKTMNDTGIDIEVIHIRGEARVN